MLVEHEVLRRCGQGGELVEVPFSRAPPHFVVTGPKALCSENEVEPATTLVPIPFQDHVSCV